MIAGLGKFWRDLMCENDANTTYCPVRVGGFGVLATYLGVGIRQAATSHAFDFIAFGTGAAAILGVLAGGIAIKSKMGADAP